MTRRCLICANINPCREHSYEAQRAELARNDAEIAKIRAREAREKWRATPVVKLGMPRISGAIIPCTSREEWVATLAAWLGKHGHPHVDCGRYAIELLRDFEDREGPFGRDGFDWTPCGAEEWAILAIDEAKRDG